MTTTKNELSDDDAKALRRGYTVAGIFVGLAILMGATYAYVASPHGVHVAAVERAPVERVMRQIEPEPLRPVPGVSLEPLPPVMEPVETYKPVEVKPFEVLVTRDYYLRLKVDGKIQVRTGGSLTWRYNNPSKLAFSPWVEKQGGKKPKFANANNDDKVAVFGSEEAGQEAARVHLFMSPAYADLTLNEAMKKYAPPERGYATASYLKKILAIAKVDPARTMKSYSRKEQDKILDGVKEAEDWVPGQVYVYDSEADLKKRGW